MATGDRRLTGVFDLERSDSPLDPGCLRMKNHPPPHSSEISISLWLPMNTRQCEWLAVRSSFMTASTNASQNLANDLLEEGSSKNPAVGNTGIKTDIAPTSTKDVICERISFLPPHHLNPLIKIRP